MKKLLSVILTITMIFSIVPINSAPAFAANNTNDNYSFSSLNQEIDDNNSLQNRDEYIYYSDLFYGYSSYLNSYSLNNHHLQTQMAMSNVFSEYVETPAFGWAGFSETLDLFSSMSDLAKAYTDQFGLTNFQYNNDLDVANRKFASNLFALKMGVGDGLSNIGKTSKKFDSVVSTIEKIYEAKETDTMVLTETITLVLDDTKTYCNYTASFIPSLNEQALTYLDKLSDPLDTTSEIFEFASALATAIVMEDVRFELIDDIIKTQEKGSILYEGMTRLYSQLKAGYIDYFVETYFTNKIIDKIAEGITKNVQNILLSNINGVFAAVTSCVALINNIVFDWILGDTFSTLEDYRVTMILAQYSDLLYDSVINKQKRFTKQFEHSQIKEYETLFEAYLSATEYALEQCADLAYYNAVYDPSYVNDKIYTWCSEFTYYDYINDVKNTINEIPLSERNFVNFEELTLSNIQICYGTDNIMNNCFYFVNGRCNANIVLSCLTIEEGKSFTVNGDVLCTMEFVNNGELTVRGNLKISNEKNINNGIFTILGNVQIKDNYFNTAVLTNYGTMNVTGDFYIDIAFYTNHGITKIKGNLNIQDSTMPFSSGDLAMNRSGAILCVGGDVYGNLTSAFAIKEGTVVLNGTQQQTVTNLYAKSVVIENESDEGVVFNSSISPSVLFNHNQNKFTLYNNGVGSIFVDYDGDSMKDNVDPFPTIFHLCDNDGHIWLDATCGTPKICKVCKLTHGNALAHKYDNAYDAVCNECGYERSPYIPGDVDGEEGLSLNDAIYLLYYVNFPAKYTVNQPVDYNSDSMEDLNDAIYLLYHVNFPEKYPLN